MPEPTQICVELVTMNEPGSDPASHRLQLAVTDQLTNVVLGDGELGGDIVDGQGHGPFHTGSIAQRPYALGFRRHKEAIA